MLPHSLKIAIIIVGFHSHDDLPDCFESISRSTLKPYELYFLENAINDGSAKYIKENYPETLVFQSEENLGFAGGNNFLLKKALKSDAEAFLLLNPDTILDPDCLSNLAKNFEAETILQPLILLYENGAATNLVNTWGNPLHYLGFSYAGGNKNPLPQGEGEEITLASGAAVLIPRQALEKAGFFDESFFLYHEDADLSWRFHIYGFKIRSIYSAKVWHKYEFSKNTAKFYYVERNRITLLIKNYQLRTLLLILPMLLLTESFLVLFSILSGWFPEKIKSYASVIQLLPTTLVSRKKIQRERVKSDKVLYKYLSTRLAFSELDSAPIKFYNILAKAYWGMVNKI